MAKRTKFNSNGVQRGVNIITDVINQEHEEMVLKVEEKIRRELQLRVMLDVYGESQPKHYLRTGALRESVDSKISKTRKGGSLITVGFDKDVLHGSSTRWFGAYSRLDNPKSHVPVMYSDPSRNGIEIDTPQIINDGKNPFARNKTKFIEKTYEYSKLISVSEHYDFADNVAKRIPSSIAKLR